MPPTTASSIGGPATRCSPSRRRRCGRATCRPRRRPIYDPATGNADGSGRAAFANNAIPQARFDPIALKILANIPLPTFPDRLTNNYFASGPFSVTRNKYDGKLTWNATGKLNVNGRVGVLEYEMLNPPAFGDVGPGVHSAGRPRGARLRNDPERHDLGELHPEPDVRRRHATSASRGSTRRPSLRGWTRTSAATILGIPGTNGADGEREYGGYPSFSVTNYANFGKANSPIYYLDPAYEYVANASWSKQTHNVRFGINVARQKMDNFEVQGAGAFSFSGGSTALRGGASPNQFNSMADFLLGYVSAGSRSILLDDAATSRTWAFSLYARDQWQMSRKLTLSYGVRWDYFPMGVAKDRGFQKYDWNNEQDAAVRRRVHSRRLRRQDSAR